MIQKIDKSKVLDYIKESKVPVGKKAIVEATGYRGDFTWCIRSLMEENEELQKSGTSRNVTYIWKPKKVLPQENVMETKKNELYSEMKNSEGYSDGTAGRALANVMRTQAGQRVTNGGKYPMVPDFGEVWSIAKDPKTKKPVFKVEPEFEGFLIISAKEYTVICYSVFTEKMKFMKPDYTLRWADNKGMHYVHMLNPINISVDKVEKRLFKIGTAEKECVKLSVLTALGLEVPETKIVEKEVIKEVPVEKIVEKKVEVPVEVEKEIIKEVPVEVERIVEKEVYRTDPTEIELAVLKAKCEIYEKIIFSPLDQKRSMIAV